MSDSRFDVCVDWDGQTIVVGTLFANTRGATVTFAYSDEWLNRPNAFAIDPVGLPLRAGGFHMTGLPRAVADTGPDRWGRVIIERAVRQGLLAKKPYRDIDYLVAVEDATRIGALRIRNAGEAGFLGPAHGVIPPLIELRRLQAAADAMHHGSATTRDIAFLLGAGSSIGGARPKSLVVMPDGRLAIAKFSKPDDIRDVAMGEILALAVAREAGIRTADHQIEILAGRGVAIIQRFDRENGRRIPFISAFTLLGLPIEDRGSYTLLADAIRVHGEDVAADLAELFRRLVYSILVGNIDDHLRNHGFLMRMPGRWSLSPAYDINPAPEIDRFHGRVTPVSEDSAGDHEIAAEMETALASCKRFGLDMPAARTVVTEVQAAMARWRSIGKRAGVSDSAIDAYADAFESP
jgi:serine/threonine-protein kinase HipA